MNVSPRFNPLYQRVWPTFSWGGMGVNQPASNALQIIYDRKSVLFYGAWDAEKPGTRSPDKHNYRNYVSFPDCCIAACSNMPFPLGAGF
jgi:hypothetical protein